MSPAIEALEERAAIHEYEAGIARRNAESMALKAVIAEFGVAVGHEVMAHLTERRRQEGRP